MWAPLEVAKFESAICVFGKMFHLIQKVVSDLGPQGAALAVCGCLCLLVAVGGSWCLRGLSVVRAGENQVCEGNRGVLLCVEEERELPQMEGHLQARACRSVTIERGREGERELESTA